MEDSRINKVVVETNMHPLGNTGGIEKWKGRIVVSSPSAGTKR
jgi:hypothetical protein